MMETVHAGCVARFTHAGWGGVLVRGSSGVGKSDLMLRLIERGWMLVGDDRLHLWASAGRLYARGAPALAGLIEARGLGVLRSAWRPSVQVRLIIDCVAPEVELERTPAAGVELVSCVSTPRLELRPLEASASAKVEGALARVMAAGNGF